MKALWLILVSTTFVLAVWSPIAAADGQSCSALFNLGRESSTPSYRALNPTAAQGAEDYRQLNQRSLRSYARLLFRSNRDFIISIRTGDTVLDIGGGRGRAMWDLANRLRIQALVINTQDYAGSFDVPKVGTLDYMTGWAEEVLPSMRSDSVNEAFDVYGAFHYSTKKDLLVEEIFRVLKPGGRARIVFDFVRSPAFVQTATGLMRFDDWLVKTDPEIFSKHTTSDFGHPISIILVRKPNTAPSLMRSLMARLRLLKFSLGLQVVEEEPHPLASSVTPRVIYRAK